MVAPTIAIGFQLHRSREASLTVIKMDRDTSQFAAMTKFAAELRPKVQVWRKHEYAITLSEKTVLFVDSSADVPRLVSNWNYLAQSLYRTKLSAHYIALFEAGPSHMPYCWYHSFNTRRFLFQGEPTWGTTNSPSTSYDELRYKRNCQCSSSHLNHINWNVLLNLNKCRLSCRSRLLYPMKNKSRVVSWIFFTPTTKYLFKGHHDCSSILTDWSWCQFYSWITFQLETTTQIRDSVLQYQLKTSVDTWAMTT